MIPPINKGNKGSWAISPAANHSAAPSGLSRFASQAKPAAIIAGTGLIVLFLCFILPAIFAGA